MKKFIVAAIQMDTQNDKQKNLYQMSQYIDEAAKKGAYLIVFPEVANTLQETLEDAESIPGETVNLLIQKAKEHQIWIHGGSISEFNPNGMRTYNTSVLITPNGEIAAQYRKLHNFDMILPDGSYVRESDNKEQGDRITTIETELGHLGFSICYDIRFPELFRLMRQKGVEIVFVPANFTLQTGKDHWETLLRARAIENGIYIIAPNQTGNKGAFIAYGNSMIIDPWGNVIARAAEKPGIILAEIDLEYLLEVRTKNPSFDNCRTDLYHLTM